MSRTWRNGEPVDSFWVDVQQKARYCGFCGECGDKLMAAIWARNFVDADTQAEINKDAKLKATDCYRIAKGHENARLNKETWAKEVKTPEVVEVNRVQASSYKKQKQKGPNASRSPECTRCGMTHPPRSCPAFGCNCKRCGKLGHFEKCCYGTAVNAVTINAMGHEPETVDARGAVAAWSPEDRLRDEMNFRGMAR
jgi:hypothetical protein